MENQTHLIRAYKAGFVEMTKRHGISKSEIPQMIEKSAAGGLAAVGTGLAALLSGLGGAAANALPAAADLIQWAPWAMAGAGALGGATYALAEGQHRVQGEKLHRDERKLDSLLASAAAAKKMRMERRKKIQKKKKELNRHAGGMYI